MHLRWHAGPLEGFALSVPVSLKELHSLPAGRECGSATTQIGAGQRLDALTDGPVWRRCFDAPASAHRIAGELCTAGTGFSLGTSRHARRSRNGSATTRTGAGRRFDAPTYAPAWGRRSDAPLFLGGAA